MRTAKIPEKPDPGDDVVKGRVCPIKSLTIPVEAQGVIAGASAQLNGMTLNTPCLRSCGFFVRSNKSDDGGECAVATIARSLRGIIRVG